MAFFSLSMISITQKMATVFTLLFAYIFLKERVSKFDLLMILVATLASIIVTLGDND